MTDKEFLQGFETCSLAKHEFNHGNHLRLAWIYLSHYPFQEALLKIEEGILRYARHLGAAHIYNETLTRSWANLIAQRMQEGLSSFEEFIQKNPELLAKDLLK